MNTVASPWIVDSGGGRQVHSLLKAAFFLKFLRLAGYTANVDLAEYPIKEVGREVAILVAMLQGTSIQGAGS